MEPRPLAAPGGWGVVHKLDPNGHYNVLHNVTNALDGGVPYAGVIRDSAGNIAVPKPLGNLDPGRTVTAEVTFPASAGNPGAAAVLTIGGTYTGGSFNTASRITLP